MSGKYLISDSERENCMAAIKEAVKHATLAYEFVSRTAGEPRGLFHRQLDHATGARTQGQTVNGKSRVRHLGSRHASNWHPNPENASADNTRGSDHQHCHDHGAAQLALSRGPAMTISYDELAALAGNHAMADTACPLCGPGRRSPANRKRRVLRIWHTEPGFASYCCARCRERGWARENQVIAASRSRRA